MNGPQHYAEAEKLVRDSQDASWDDGHAPYLLAAAQVHATLALVAAHVEAEVLRGWGEVAR